MPFAQSKKTKSHEPLQRIWSPMVDASAGRKTRASAPMIAQIVLTIFAFISKNYCLTLENSHLNSVLRAFIERCRIPQTPLHTHRR